MQGVGLVNEHEELSFAPTGMTLVYGQNAVGKSSYVRALKMLCRTVDRDCRVRGSIYDAATHASPPSVRIKIDIEGATTERRIVLDGSVTVQLPGVSVFDSACAELYVDAQNTVQYIPTELRLLARLAALQDRMRHVLAEERDAQRNTRPSLERYPTTTQVGRTLAQLSSRRTDSDLAALATLTDVEVGRLADLRARVASAATATAREDAAAAWREAG